MVLLKAIRSSIVSFLEYSSAGFTLNISTSSVNISFSKYLNVTMH
ncbi:hypothetical protein LDVICp130 [lymphocystis disease virus-China]|uniref:Uncharacterized protein n=1 Tax=lymphocystis disease virus-China TaxID=256729 RepID=Q677Y2_9VIRU|nr:hypothetical protein LDVICp130 [lymphocystis disease virus-China]AAU10975.1 hypothetical protein [lymphocystis disease virus-China]